MSHSVNLRSKWYSSHQQKGFWPVAPAGKLLTLGGCVASCIMHHINIAFCSTYSTHTSPHSLGMFGAELHFLYDVLRLYLQLRATCGLRWICSKAEPDSCMD